MKRLLIAVFLVGLISTGWATPIKKASELFSMDIHLPLDSAGIPGTPDSMHIITYADNGSGTLYNARSVTAPFSDISIDTTNQYGSVKYILVDAIGDLDGAGGNFLLTVKVASWYKKLPRYTFGQVQVVNDSLTTGIDDAVAAAGDVVNIDAWDPILDNDSLIVDQSSLEDMTVATVTNLTNAVTLVAGQFTKIGDTSAVKTWSLGTRTLTVADWNVGKTGYSLTTADWNVGKTGYSLSSPQTFNLTGDITGNLSGSVGSVTDSVKVDVSVANTAGNLVDKIAATSADSTWDEINTGATHNVATSAGRQLRELANAGVLSSGDAQGGGATYIVLAAAESQADDWYNNTQVAIVGGTGEGQIRHVHDYTGATDSITLIQINTWVTNPDATSEYVIRSDVVKHVSHIDDDVIDVGVIAAGAITSSEAPALGTIQDSVNKVLDSIYVLTPLTREMQADVDSLILFGGYGPNCRALAGADSETDTLNVYDGATRMLRFLYWHIGGATGDDPDSTTNLDN